MEDVLISTFLWQKEQQFHEYVCIEALWSNVLVDLLVYNKVVCSYFMAKFIASSGLTYLPKMIGINMWCFQDIVLVDL